MKLSLIHGFLVGLSLTVGYLSVARADLPPPDGYVEQCTVNKQQTPGKTCVACKNDFSGSGACQQKYGPQGYTKGCQSWGGSVWTEVWCTGNLDAGTNPVGTCSSTSTQSCTQPDAGNQVTSPVGSCSCRTHSQRGRGSMAAVVVLCTLVSIRLLKRRSRG